MDTRLTGRNVAPLPRSQLIGREQERESLISLLNGFGAPLVTITGPGGVGKTRLALQVASDAAVDFPDGVAFIDLAPVANAGLVLNAIAQELGALETCENSLIKQIADRIEGRRMLLVLDNFEHLLDSSADLAQMLICSRELRILATSRERLNLRDEWVFALQPLRFPAQDRLCSIEEMRDYPAIQLFIARAQSVKTSFAFTNESAVAVAGICARVDGLPLAIELAAARVNLLSPTELLKRMEPRLPLLSGTVRDGPPRQRTMSDAIAWSYNLLADEERAFLRRLAVFAGSWNFEMVDAVCPSTGGTANRNLDYLQSLIDKSLIQPIPDTEGGPRFSLLATIREFACQKLRDAGEFHEVQRLLADFLISLAREEHPCVGSSPGRAWLDRLQEVEAEIWGTLEWATASKEIETGMRLAAPTFLYWYLRRRRLTEVRAWLENALSTSRNGDIAREIFALTLNCASGLAHLQHDLERAEAHAQDAAKIWEELGNPREIAFATYLLAIPTAMRGETARAEGLYLESIAGFRRAGDRYFLPEVLLGLANVRIAQQRCEEATSIFESVIEMLATLPEIEASSTLAIALTNFGFLASYSGERNHAKQLLGSALQLWTGIDDPSGIIDCLEGLGCLNCSAGFPVRAARLLGAAEVLRERAGIPVSSSGQESYRSSVAGIRRSLTMIQFATAWAEGRVLPVEEAINLALGDIGIPDRIVGGLSRRELQVVCLVAQGLTDREIADRLYISRRTASDHVSHILQKLNVATRVDAKAWAMAHSLA